jgi:hypothetical protein
MSRTLELTDTDGLHLITLLSLPGEDLDGRSGAFGFRGEVVIQFYLATRPDKPLMTCALRTLQQVSEDFSLNGPVIEKAEVTRVIRWVREEMAKADSYKTFKARPFIGSRPSGLAERLVAA